MKTVNITLCSCNKYLDRFQWKPYKSIEKLIIDKVKKQVPNSKIIFKSLEIPMHPKEKKSFEIIAKTKKAEHVVDVVLKLAKCNLCEKEGTQYYEAVLQVRSSNFDILDKSIEFLKKRVENLRHKGMFINKVEREDDGYDLYVTNKSIAQHLGRELQDLFGGEYKSSARLFSKNKQTSKNIYRVAIFVRLPGFERHDIILVDDKVYKVDKLGSKITLLDLLKNNHLIIDFSKLEYAVLKKHVTYVARTHPYLEVINPFDFQSSMVRNHHENGFELGQEVKVVVHKGIYVVD
jgi:NMD protein affecting ribosome stability and mRNA decay